MFSFFYFCCYSCTCIFLSSFVNWSRCCISRLLTVENKGGLENSGGFKLAKDGRLIIENLDLDESNRRKRKSFAEALDVSDKKLKKDGESEVNDNEDDNSDIKVLFFLF